jgi:hypothetical protein
MVTVNSQYAVLFPCLLHNYLFKFYLHTGKWDLEWPWISWKDQFLEQVIMAHIMMGWNISEVIYEHQAFQTHRPVVDIGNITFSGSIIEKQMSFNSSVENCRFVFSIFGAEGESVLCWFWKSCYPFVTARIKHIILQYTIINVSLL